MLSAGYLFTICSAFIPASLIWSRFFHRDEAKVVAKNGISNSCALRAV